MITNGSKLSGIQKSAIVLLFFNNKDKKIAKKIMSELSPEKAEKVKKLLSHFPIFKKEDVKRTLEEFYQMSIEKAQLFPNQTLLTEMESITQEMIRGELEGRTESEVNLLEDITEKQLTKLLSENPIELAALLIYFSKPDLAGVALGSLPKDTTEKIMKTYLNMSPPSMTLIKKFKKFLTEKLQEAPQIDSTTNLAKLIQMVEVSEDSLINTIKEAFSETTSDLEWALLEENLLRIEDIEHIKEQDLYQVFGELKDPKEVSTLIKTVDKRSKSKIWNALTDRTKAFVKEEIDILPDPITDDMCHNAKISLFTAIRSLQNQGLITAFKMPTGEAK